MRSWKNWLGQREGYVTAVFRYLTCHPVDTGLDFWRMQNHHSSDSSMGVRWCAETLREFFRLHLCWDANVTAAECHHYPESLTYFLRWWGWKKLKCIKLDYKFHQISWTICNPLNCLFLKPNRAGHVASTQKCFLKYYFVDELQKKKKKQGSKFPFNISGML